MSPGRGKAKGKKKHPKKKKHHLELKPKNITIHKCSAVETYVNKPDEEAVWYSGDQDTYKIKFHKGPPGSSRVSPFTAGDNFTVTPGPPTHSGQIWPNAVTGKYRYRVKGKSGCDIDPVIHIGP